MTWCGRVSLKDIDGSESRAKDAGKKMQTDTTERVKVNSKTGFSRAFEAGEDQKERALEKCGVLAL